MRISTSSSCRGLKKSHSIRTKRKAIAIINRNHVLIRLPRSLGPDRVFGSDTKINRAKAAARAQALRPHIERCLKAGRTSSNAIAADLNARGIAAPNGGQWFPMQVRRVRDRLGL